MTRIQYTPAEIISFYQVSDKPEHFERFGPVAYQSKFKPLKATAGPEPEHKALSKPSDQFASVLDDSSGKGAPVHQHPQQPSYVCRQPYPYYSFMYPGYGYPPGFGPEDGSFPGSQQYGVQMNGPGEMDFPSVVGGAPKGNEFMPRRTQSGFPGFAPEPTESVFPPRSSSTEMPSFRFPPQKEPAFAPRPDDPYKQEHDMAHGFGQQAEPMVFAPRHIPQSYAFPPVVGPHQQHDVGFAPSPMDQGFVGGQDFESVVGFDHRKVEQPTFAPKHLDDQYRDDFAPMTTFPPSKKAESGIASFAPKMIDQRLDDGFPSVVDYPKKTEEIPPYPKFAPRTLQETNFGDMFGFPPGKEYPRFAPQPLSDEEMDGYPPLPQPAETFGSVIGNSSFPGVLDQPPPRPSFAPMPVSEFAPAPLPDMLDHPTMFHPSKEPEPLKVPEPEPEPVRPKQAVPFSVIQEEQAKQEKEELGNPPPRRPTKPAPSFASIMKEDVTKEAKSENSTNNFSPKLISEGFYVCKTPIPDLGQASQMHQGGYGRRHW